jgi:aerobic carbon-monoxide dehydrogenase medium subunit
MYPAPFDYISVRSWDEAIAVLIDRAGEEAKVLGGGQSLVPMMALRLARPSCLVDINGIEDGAVRVEGEHVVVPALTRHADVETSPELRRHCPVLPEAASLIGNVRVRHRGTIGGSLAHADPSAELPCVAVATGSEIVAVGPDGTRSIPAGEFFLGHFTSALGPAELVREVRVPALRPTTGWAFLEFMRRGGDFAVVEVAVLVELEGDGATCARAEVVIGGVADRPVRASGVSEALMGGQLDEARIAEGAERAREAVNPTGDAYASAAYRKDLVRTLTGRALALASDRAAAGNGMKVS